MRSRLTLFSLVLVFALLFTACAPPMEAPAPTGGDSAAAADTSTAAVSTGDIPREKTLIIGFEGGPAAAPEQAGLNPGSMRAS